MMHEYSQTGIKSAYNVKCHLFDLHTVNYHLFDFSIKCVLQLLLTDI